MKLDAYASLPHYYEHLAPVWAELQQRGVAGQLYGPRPGSWGPVLRGRAHADRPMLVASFADYGRVAPSPVVYLEHGAGQTYDGDATSARNSCYSGGEGLARALLFVCPSEVVADRWRANYDVPAVAVGCPKLDRWHRPRHVLDPNGPNTIALTFHWRCPLVQEANTAWAHYDRTLPQLRGWLETQGFRLLMHGHPRISSHVERRARSMGVEFTRELSEVFDRARLLIGDNTSALPEFASLGRPVLWLNAPWYRRDVEHGGRFWTWPRGQCQVDEPGQLIDGVVSALRDDFDVFSSREAMVRSIYAHTDGRAAERAADAIVEVLGEQPVRRQGPHPAIV